MDEQSTGSCEGNSGLTKVPGANGTCQSYDTQYETDTREPQRPTNDRLSPAATTNGNTNALTAE